MTIWERILNFYHIKKHDTPSRKAVEKALNSCISKSSKFQDLKARRFTIATEYALLGDDIESISKRHECTRERVRQILWKVYREGLNL